MGETIQKKGKRIARCKISLTPFTTICPFSGASHDDTRSPLKPPTIPFSRRWRDFTRDGFLVDKVATRLEMLRSIHGLASEAKNPVASHNPTSQGRGQTDIAWHIRRLSPFDRSPLLLTSVEELSHEDTAWILRTSKSQIVPRLVQARERLRESVDSRSRQHLTSGGHLRRVK